MVIVAFLLLLAGLVGLASIRPNRSTLTEFELRRRLDAKEEGSLLEWRRGELRAEIMTLRRLAISFTLVVASALLILNYGWDWGLLMAFIVTLSYNRIADFGLMRGIFQRAYNRYEEPFLRFVENWQGLIRPLSGYAERQVERKISSREELEYLFSQLSDILSADERRTLTAMLWFQDKIVKDHMTPRSAMEAVGAHELLGPLVLDNLHRTGHTHFPVFDGDIDHLVGILHIYSLFTLDNKKSLKVKDAMEPRVFYIHQDQPLTDALAACIKHRRHLLVVINEYRETVGVVTIEDAVEELIGRKIVDQFAEHDDLRKVAARNPRRNNTPPKAVDV
jgi:CBS domain containing-hemolysin-like protein